MGWNALALLGAGAVLLTFLAPDARAASAPRVLLAAPPRQALGMYAVPASACSLVAAAGFTVIQNYDFEVRSFADSAAFVPEARAYLDAAARSSLQVLLGVPRTWLRDRRAADLQSVMRALRAHPALLAWYEDEIAAGGDLGSVQFLSTLVRDEDPTHGLIIEEGNPDHRLLPIGRIRMFTYYPVTDVARRSGRLHTLSERLSPDSLRTPFWPVLQAFGRDLVTGPAKHDLLTPRPDELRFSLCSAMLHGARGLFFYPYMHATTYSAAKAAAGQFAYGTYRPLPEIAPQLWSAVLDCVRLASRLLALTEDAAPAPAVTLEGAPAGVEWRTWETPDGVLAVIANPAFTPCSIRVRAPVGTSRGWILAPAGADAQKPVTNGVLELEVPGPGGLAVKFDSER
jgi:hypothetical protein